MLMSMNIYKFMSMKLYMFIGSSTYILIMSMDTYVGGLRCWLIRSIKNKKSAQFKKHKNQK